jgi:hypothetical protein
LGFLSNYVWSEWAMNGEWMVGARFGTHCESAWCRLKAD